MDKLTGRPLGNGVRTLMLPWAGRRIGLLGLVEQEWLVTLASIEVDDVVFSDFVTVGTQLAAELRAAGADFVIVLTHMRRENDKRLACKVKGVDLILGGHDHDYSGN